MLPLRVLALGFVLVIFAGLALGACQCTQAPRACKDSTDCFGGEACLQRADGTKACASDGGEGEGEGSPGEGEGEGAEGEGEGEGAVCGDGAVGGSEACDDGNANNKDLCSSSCAATTVAVTTVLGVQPLRALPLLAPQTVWSQPNRGTVVGDGIGALFFAPPGSDEFFRVDGAFPLTRSSSANTTLSTATSAAITPTGQIVYFDDAANVVLSLDPATGDTTVVAGTGTVGSAPFDPPGFVFSGGPLSVEIDNTRAIDVDNAGTLYIAGDARVIAVDADGTTRVVAGSIASGVTTGTAAQNTRFNEVNDVSVEYDAGGDAVGLWIAGIAFGDVKPMHVGLADGSFAQIFGEGSACNNQPASGCQLSAGHVVDDGAGGVYTVASSVGAGMFHLDAQQIVHTVTADDVGFASDLSVVEPGVIAVPRIFNDQLALVHDDGTQTVERIEPPRPTRGTDHTLFPLGQAAGSDGKIFFATLFDLWSVDASGALAHIVNVADLGPCSHVNELTFFSGLAATSDGSAVFFSQRSDHRICRLDVASGVVTSPFPAVAAPTRMTLRTDELLVINNSQIVRVPLDGTAVTTVRDFGMDSPIDIDSLNDVAQVLLGSGARGFVTTPPTSTVTTASTATLNTSAILADSGAASTVYDDASSQLKSVTNAAQTVLAGAGAGFVDGPAASARFEVGPLKLVRLGDGSIGIVSATSIRLLDPAQTSVVTIVGSDQFTDDGPFDQARLAQPASLSCEGTRCVVADVATETLRQIDFTSGSVKRVHGADGARVTGLAFALQIDDDNVIYSDGNKLHEVDVPSGTDTIFAQGAFVGSPTLLADVGDGGVVFYDGANLKLAAPVNPRVLTGAPGTTALAVDRLRGEAWSASLGGVGGAPVLHVLALAAPPTTLSDDVIVAAVDNGATAGPAPTRVSALALDAASNLYVATDVDVREYVRAGDGSLDAVNARVLVESGAAQLPFVGCAVGLAIENDDVIVADACTGAVLRIAIQ